MEVNNSDVATGVVAALTASVAWIWKRINGDIKANKKAIEMLSASSVSHTDLTRVVERMDKGREEFRDTIKAIFDRLDEHAEADSKNMADISRILGRLEERSAKRRGSDI